MDRITLDLSIVPDSTLDVQTCIQDANSASGTGDEVWRSLWHDPHRTNTIQAVQKIVQPLRANCKNLLILGIGGSALGSKALHESLTPENGVPLFVLDNVDPHTVQRTINSIQEQDPSFENTVVAVISKSGETAEITALLMVIEQAMPHATFVAITGVSGMLRDIATQRSWETLTIPEGVGGRFSVLCPVGLFPAAMCGIDIDNLLAGAAFMDDLCRQEEDNPAAMLAAALVSALQQGRTMHIMMPYCDRLQQFAHWYVQLWAESLGKKDAQGTRVGPTPIPAIGATDQHSMLQLWREGPADKVIGFVRVHESSDIELGTIAIHESKEWLCGQTLGSLLQAEQTATEESMRDADQETWTLTLPRIDASTIGQFIALWQDTVAIAGRLLQVNPYDQPGVELSKTLTKSTLEAS